MVAGSVEETNDHHWPRSNNGGVCDGKGLRQDVLVEEIITSGVHFFFVCRFWGDFFYFFFGGGEGMCQMRSEMAPRTTATAQGPYAATRHHGSHGGGSQRKQHLKRRKTM